MLDVPDFTVDPIVPPTDWVPAPIARAEAIVRRPDGSIRGRVESDWEVFRADVKQIISLAAILDDNVHTETFNDTGGTGRSFRALTDNVSNFNAYNGNQGGGISMAAELPWGSDGTAAADTDFQLVNRQDSIQISDDTVDKTNDTYTATGAKKFTGSSTTLRELGYVRIFPDTGNNNREILLDRAVVAATTVNTDDTVTITYTWTW